MEDHEIRLVELLKTKESVQLSYDKDGWSKLEYKQGEILYSENTFDVRIIENEVISELKAFQLIKNYLESDARKWGKDIPRSGEDLITYWRDEII